MKKKWIEFSSSRIKVLQGSYPSLNKKFKDFLGTFKDTFPILKDSIQCKKRAYISLCLFKFFHNMTNFILKVFLCLLLLGTWESGLDTVNTKIQGLSSTPTVILKDFQQQHHVIACLHATILIVPSFTHGAPIKAYKVVIGEVTVPQTWREHLPENGSWILIG